MNNGKICVSVCVETADEMIGRIKQAEQFADVIELRFDCLKPTEFSPLHTGTMSCYSNKPVISTFRTLEQGGKREITPAEREEFWNAGNESAFCDVEEDIVDWTWYWLWGNRICSYHALSGVPADMPALFDRVSNAGADKAGAGVPISRRCPPRFSMTSRVFQFCGISRSSNSFTQVDCGSPNWQMRLLINCHLMKG